MAMFWLIFQSFKLYIGARSFSTKTESGFLKKYSPVRYFYVLLIPFIILIALTVGVWAYRYYLIVFTLDVIAPLNPQGTLDIYKIVVDLILPFLYISLIIIFVLVVTEFILTRRSVNRRSGTFDNFAFSLIVGFMFVYLAWNVTLYLFLNDITIQAVKGVGGDLGRTSFLFLGEFAFSMLFLFRAIRKTGKSFGWNLLFLNQDAMIMMFLASIFAQTTSRLAVMISVPGQTLGPLTDLIGLDKLIIPVFILVILGITLLIYYIKPQEVSMFMRIAKQSVDKEDKDMDIILKYLRREYIRRGQKFAVRDVESHLISISNLQRGQIHSVIDEISNKYIDVVVTTEKSGKFVDFVNITDKYESSKKGESKAEKLMRERLSDTLSIKKKQKKLAVQKDNVTKVEERSAFLTALDSSFQKRVQDEKKAKKTTISKEFKTSIEDVDQDTIDLIMSLMKNEYLHRLNRREFADPRIKISEIADKVFETTKLSPGLLYPLLKKISDEDWNVTVETSGTEGDAYLSFTPIDDWEMYNSIRAKRPEELIGLKTQLWTWLIDSTKNKKQAIINTIRVSDKWKGTSGKEANMYLPELFSLDLFYSSLLDYFNKNYKDVQKFPKWAQNYSELNKYLQIFKDLKAKEIRINEPKSK
jgi:hypothetical protein